MSRISFFLRHGLFRQAFHSVISRMVNKKADHAESRFVSIVLPQAKNFSLSRDIYDFEYPVNNQWFRFRLNRKESDVEVFMQVILQQQYLPAVELLLPADGRPLKIIDAGSNIGLTTLFLKAFFPQAAIICLEPSERNAAACEYHLNANALKEVTLLRKALWHRPAMLVRQSFRDGRSWAFSFGESKNESGEAEGITLADVVNHAGWQKIDLLKLDVEGAEAVLLRDSGFMQLLSAKVRLFVVEVHEESISRCETEALLLQAGFRFFHSGELLIAMNRTLY